MFLRRSLKCSFCGRAENEVSKLVAGARAYMCDECVTAASNIMQRQPSEPHQIPTQRSLWHRLARFAKNLLHYDAVLKTTG